MTISVEHSQASNAVRFWNAARAASHFERNETGFVYIECEPSHRLEYPDEGFAVSVTFTEIEGHPELMRVRSTNWRCEHEPNGIYLKTDCRKFYRQLLNTGMVAQ